MRTLKDSFDVTQTLRKHKEWLDSNGEKGEAAVFIDCSFNHQVIAGERLDRVRFINCNFYVGTISNCDLNDTEFVDCEFVKLHISGSRMSNCVFKDCELRFCEFYGTAIVKTSLIHCLVIADEFKEMLLTNNNTKDTYIDTPTDFRIAICKNRDTVRIWEKLADFMLQVYCNNEEDFEDEDDFDEGDD